MNLRLALSSLAVLPLVTLASTAFAEPPGAPAGAEPEGEGRYPVAEAERPLTLPRMILSPEIDLDVTHVAAPPAVAGIPGTGSSFGNLTLGASFGITDDLSVRATVLPLQFAGPADNGLHYGQTSENPGPSIGATYRFLRGPVEVGGSLDLALITIDDSSGVVVTPGVPVRIHIGKQIRIDTGGFLSIAHASVTTTVPSPAGPMTSSASATAESLNVPVSFLYDITEPIHVGAGTAFQHTFSSDGATTGIPLGVFAGYAVAGKDGPILDIDPFFTFVSLLTPGGTNATDSGDWVLGVSVGGFLYL